MARVIESIATINSAVRTLLMLAACGFLAAAGWLGYQEFYAEEVQRQRLDAELAATRENLDTARRQAEEAVQQLATAHEQVALQQDEITQLNAEIAHKDEEITRLETRVALLKVDQRLAELTVLDQSEDPASGQTFTEFQFVEVDEQGQPLAEPREFRIAGRQVYVEYKVVKFADQYVEESDLFRSTSICLFHRIFGEQQKPSEGFAIDQVGSRPGAYSRGSRMTEFEEKIWDDFWSLANDPQRASALGIRAIHPEAPSIMLQEGMRYQLTLRSSGGLSIKPVKRQPGEGGTEIR